MPEEKDSLLAKNAGLVVREQQFKNSRRNKLYPDVRMFLEQTNHQPGMSEIVLKLFLRHQDRSINQTGHPPHGPEDPTVSVLVPGKRLMSRPPCRC